MISWIPALQAEMLKNKRSRIVWVSFIAFGLAPVMGGIFLVLMRSPEVLSQAGGLASKAKAMNFENNWASYFSILSQAVGVGGVLVFGFVSSWIFGREYSDGTAKDLLSLPTSRTAILNTKFMVYLLWCLALCLSNLVIAFIIGQFLRLPTTDLALISAFLLDYFITAILTILVGVPIAFFAISGRGFMAPLGFVALTLVFAQVIAAMGYGTYFPWSVPGLYSGAGGQYKVLLDFYSYFLLILTSFTGYLAAVFFWKYSDQSK